MTKPQCNKCGSTNVSLVEESMCQWDFVWNEETNAWKPAGWDNFHEDIHGLRKQFIFCKDCRKKMRTTNIEVVIE